METETTPLHQAWADHQRDNGSGYQDQAFEAGWNAAVAYLHRELDQDWIEELIGELP